ncbi:MAG: BlaI/MecI/CopY family transcriptional regulator [Bacteroidota bacterium]
MKKLTEKEEAIMAIFWDQEKAFAKDVRAALPEPKPHINTVSTAIRKLVDKGFLAFEDFGSTHRYYPVIKKEEYSSQVITPKLTGLFGNSYKNVVAFFVKEEKLSVEELKDVIRMIEKGEEK